MFDESPSLPMHAALASLLGGLFSIGLILATHTAQAQGAESGTAPSAVAEEAGDAIRRIATMGALRGAAPAGDARLSGGRGLRLDPAGSAPSSGLRWQVGRLKGLRSDGEVPRSRDLVSVGMQVRF